MITTPEAQTPGNVVDSSSWRFDSPMSAFVIILGLIEAAICILAYTATGTPQVILVCGLLIGLAGIAVGCPLLGVTQPQLFEDRAGRSRLAHEKKVKESVIATLREDHPRCLNHILSMLGKTADDEEARLNILASLGQLRKKGQVRHHPAQPDCWVWNADSRKGEPAEAPPTCPTLTGTIDKPRDEDVVAPNELRVHGLLSGPCEGFLYLVTGGNADRYWPSSRLQPAKNTNHWEGVVDVGHRSPTATISLVIVDQSTADYIEFYREHAGRLGHCGIYVSAIGEKLDEVRVKVNLSPANA